MTPVRPEFAPDPSLSRAEMEELQRDLAAEALFEDDFEFDPASISASAGDSTQTTLGGSAPDESSDGSPGDSGETTAPIVAGVDQAFAADGEKAVSAIVASRGGEVVERVHAVEPTEIPYIPGLLSFREGGAILSAFEELSVEPDLAVVDGSGRIHFRQAGIATHVGVMLDLPAIGVAKNLLCGRPAESLDDYLREGERVPIEADDSVTAPEGTVIGHAYQSRQYDNPQKRHVNPLYVSPGHRVSADTATDLVGRLCAGYKLPEPTRLADQFADEVKAEVGD
ncbi:endonuclease V [Halorussus gelatinilyticus]|uniref:Endonuclease V n=1 Tax=Halorussus gelatinilyticus TaxID=2937524 RepID=A0A8U0IGC9_9EURY|nr:endonuclease V [Halorussus gelatinilyticus]UPV99333.1 endonuclease V [Halorussus gelatinilyticus]